MRLSERPKTLAPGTGTRSIESRRPRSGEQGRGKGTLIEQLLRRLVGVHVGLAEGVQDVGVGVAADDLLDRLDGGLDRRGGGGRARRPRPRPVGAASPGAAAAAASHARRERGDRPNARWDGGAGGGGGARDRRRNRIKRREALGFGGVQWVWVLVWLEWLGPAGLGGCVVFQGKGIAGKKKIIDGN